MLSSAKIALFDLPHDLNKKIKASLSESTIGEHNSLQELSAGLLESKNIDIIVLSHKKADQKFYKFIQNHKIKSSIFILQEKNHKQLTHDIPFTDSWTHYIFDDFFEKKYSKNILSIAILAHRKRKRIAALREHQTQDNAPKDPITTLITDLIKKCAHTSNYADLLKPILYLKNSIQFHDCSVVFYDTKNNIVQGFHSEGEKKIDDIKNINGVKDFIVSTEPHSLIIHTGEKNSSLINDFTQHPWSSCTSIKVSISENAKSRNIQYARFFLFRRELISFSEKELWILELACGPLSLALEKIMILNLINQASKEWRSTFDAISEPITVIDDEFKIVKANKAFAKIINSDIKKIKNKKCHILLASRKTPCVNCPVAKNSTDNNLTRISKKDKNDLLVSSYSIPLQKNKFHFQFYRNMAQENALTATLVQSEKMAALGKLVSAIAHEINNPLAGILASSQLLLHDKESLEKMNILDEMEEIKSAAWRSKKIIDDLLGFTDGYHKNLESVDVNECVHTALTFSKSALKGIKVKLNLENTIPKINSSASSLQQILFNLITNASHAMKESGDIHIKSSYNQTSGLIELEVRDFGPGISENILNNIFNPFYTSKAEGQGTGLGLSIVKNLLTRMNGKISATSTLGSGTTFSILIPTGTQHG